MPHKSGRLTALVLAIAVVLIWGVSFAATRIAVQEIPPLTLAFLRFALASVILWPLVRHRWGTIRLARRDRRAGFLLGLTGVTLAFVFENLGLKYTTASHAALIVSITPLATTMTEAVLARRFPHLRTLGGLLAALAGVALIVGSSEAGAGSVVGDLLMLMTVWSWVAYSFLTQRLTRSYPTLVVTQTALVVGALTLSPLAATEVLVRGVELPSATTVVALLYLGVFCSAIAYLWWNRAIQVLGVTTTNSLIYGIPLVGVVAGVALLGEPLTWMVALGGLLIIGGVMAAGWQLHPNRDL